jgi:NAD(P)-dependent dehydrogenase (short-subunit alcohol dehydrogenase family)
MTACRSAFQPGLFQGKVAIVSGGGSGVGRCTAHELSALGAAAAFISGACLRIDGAAPNAKRSWPEVGTGGSTGRFDGFHLASMPKVLQGT